MPVKFSEDQQFLIEQLAKTPEEFKKLEQKDLDRVAELLVKHMGDMKFNKKIRSDYPRLAKFIYKTQDYGAIESINKKIQINKNLKDAGLEILEEEKLSLKEIGRLIKLSDFSTENDYSDFNRVLKYISKNSKNQDFKELYNNIALSHSTLADIKKDIIESKSYQTNDISVENMNKSKVAKGSKPDLFDYDGPLAQKLLSDGYGHAAPLYVQNNPDKIAQTQKSHITGKHEIDTIEALDILGSDTLRIDPTKLANENFTQKLEQAYGPEWQNYIKITYQELAGNLHNSLERSNTQIQELNSLSDAGYKQIQSLDTQVQNLKDSDPNSKQITSLQNEINILRASQNSRHEEIQSFKAKNVIKNDLDRLDGIGKWFSPKAIIQGHTKLGHKNDFRKLSNEMFNPTEENKKMICSEFGAVTIAASIDQLNLKISEDLQKKELITSEQEIFKNPIPKNERIDKIHPGRLVHLLKKAGAVEVRNETVDQYVKRNDLTSMKIANIELDLPNKISFLLKNSANQQDFTDKANKNLAIYLEAYKVDKEVINQIQEDAKKQFAEFHQRKNETGIITSIKKLCKGIAVSLHLREKEKSTKKLSSNILTQVEKIKKECAYTKLLNEKFYNSMVVQNKANTSVDTLKKQNQSLKNKTSIGR